MSYKIIHQVPLALSIKGKVAMCVKAAFTHPNAKTFKTGANHGTKPEVKK